MSLINIESVSKQELDLTDNSSCQCMLIVTLVPLYYDACVIFPHVIFFSSIKAYKIMSRSGHSHTAESPLMLFPVVPSCSLPRGNTDLILFYIVEFYFLMDPSLFIQQFFLPALGFQINGIIQYAQQQDMFFLV